MPGSRLAARRACGAGGRARTRQELCRLVPVVLRVVHRVVRHPHDGAGRDGQPAAGQGQVALGVDAQLAQAHGRVHAQHLLRARAPRQAPRSAAAQCMHTRPPAGAPRPARRRQGVIGPTNAALERPVLACTGPFEQAQGGLAVRRRLTQAVLVPKGGRAP